MFLSELPFQNVMLCITDIYLRILHCWAIIVYRVRSTILPGWVRVGLGRSWFGYELVWVRVDPKLCRTWAHLYEALTSNQRINTHGEHFKKGARSLISVGLL